MRLDKFLAETGRLGSRGKAVSALERGKIYLNDTEVFTMTLGAMRPATRIMPTEMDS